MNSIEVLEEWVRARRMGKGGRFFRVMAYSETGHLEYRVQLYDEYDEPQVGGPRPCYEGRGETLGLAVTRALKEAPK
jgi:hypothetical protein